MKFLHDSPFSQPVVSGDFSTLPAMCSCNFIIPHPQFSVNEIQHSFIAVSVVFINPIMSVLFVLCKFDILYIDFGFPLCHTCFYIGSSFILSKKLVILTVKEVLILCIFPICTRIPLPAAMALNVRSPIWPVLLLRRVFVSWGSQIMAPALWQPELLLISAV